MKPPRRNYLLDGLERNRKKWNAIARAWYRVSERLATWMPNVVVTDAVAIAQYYRERYRRDSIMIPYGAETGRQLRKDHEGFLPLPPTSRLYFKGQPVSVDLHNPQKYCNWFRPQLENLERYQKTLVHNLASYRTIPWNPFWYPFRLDDSGVIGLYRWSGEYAEVGGLAPIVLARSFYVNWTTQLRKGLLELAILNTLDGGSLYGYDIVRRLGDVDGLVITEGTVYPILSRLKNERYVDTYIEESPEGPARKYYRLTRSGRNELERMNEHWLRLHDAIGTLRKERAR